MRVCTKPSKMKNNLINYIETHRRKWEKKGKRRRETASVHEHTSEESTWLHNSIELLAWSSRLHHHALEPPVETIIQPALHHRGRVTGVASWCRTKKSLAALRPIATILTVGAFEDGSLHTGAVLLGSYHCTGASRTTRAEDKRLMEKHLTARCPSLCSQFFALLNVM